MSIHQQIMNEVTSWPGVTTAPHRFGGTEFRIGRRELGHLHGDRLADLPMPKRVRDELIASGRAAPHHVLPESGWISVWIHGAEDVPSVVSMFRMQFDRMTGADATSGSEAEDRA